MSITTLLLTFCRLIELFRYIVEAIKDHRSDFEDVNGLRHPANCLSNSFAGGPAVSCEVARLRKEG